MTTHKVALAFEDGVTRFINCREDQTVAVFAGQRVRSRTNYGPPPFAYGHEAEEARNSAASTTVLKGAERDFWNHRRPDVNNR